MCINASISHIEFWHKNLESENVKQLVSKYTESL